MYNRHIRHLVTELGNRLSDKEFLKKIGLSRRSMQQLFDKDRWEVIFEKAFPVTRRFSCAEILEFCRVDMEKLSNEPEEGWLSFDINIRPTFCTRMRISLCPQLLMRRLRSIS